MRKDHVFLAGTLFSVLAAGWLLWPFADAILWAGFTAYFLHYFADRLDAYVHNRTLTTAVMILVLIGFVAGLFYLILTGIPSIIDVMSRFSDVLAGSVSLFVDIFDLPPELASALEGIIADVTAGMRAWAVSQVSNVPTIVLNLVIYFVVAVFLVRDGKRFKQRLYDVVGDLPAYYRTLSVSIIESVDQLFRGVFLSYFIVSLAVGALATVGFYLMGLDFYWGWGLIIGVFAFFPIVSAPMVYGPLSLLYIAIGDFWLGVIILVYGVVVLNTLPEVVLRPYLAAHHTQEHPLLLFVGFIIGPMVLGFKGIILGPIILVVAKNMLAMKYLPPETFDD